MIAVAVPKLPTLALPTTLAVPEIFAPVDVTTNCAVALPPIKVETLPADVMVILLVLFFINPLLIVVILPVVAINVVVPKLPVLALLVTFNNVVVKLPVAALNDKLALAPCAKLPEVAFANNGYQVPVVVNAVLAYSETLALATNKLGTRVVLVTVNGAVPMAIFETNIGLVTAVVALRLAAMILPEETVSVVVLLSNVNDATPFVIFWSLNCTAVFAPPAITLLDPPPAITVVATPVFAVAVMVVPFAPTVLPTSVYNLTLPEVG